MAAALVILVSRRRSVSLRGLAVTGLCAAARPLSARSVCATRPRSPVSDGPAGPRFVGSRGRPQIYLALSQPIRHLCSDGSNLEGRLIYSGNLARVVLGVKFFSYSTSIFTLCMMPYILLHSGLGIQSPAVQVAFCGIMGFFTFLSPLVLHFLTRGYVIHLYHDAKTDNYTAITYSILLQQKKTVFHQKDVKVPGVSKLFTTFYANNKSLLVNPVLFWHPNDYSHLMGYDQPFSFNLDELKK